MRRGAGVIRAVSFDVGGTLLAPWPSVGSIYREEAVRLGLGSPDAGQVDEAFRRVWKRETALGAFDYSLEGWARMVAGVFDGLIAEPGSRELFEALYERFRGASVWREYDDVRGCLGEMKRRGVRCGVISNWDERLAPLLREMGLWEDFEVCLVSREVGHPKPSTRIFERFCESMGVRAEEVAHVGDGWREDVEGALGVGMRAVWLDRGRGGGDGVDLGVARVRTLGELPEILDQLR